MCRVPPKVRFIGLTDTPSGWIVDLSITGNTLEDVLTNDVLDWIDSTDTQCACETYDYFLTNRWEDSIWVHFTRYHRWRDRDSHL